VLARSTSRDPLGYLTTLEDPVIQTPSHRVHAHSTFDITFGLHRNQQRLKLSLEPNHGILAEGASVQFLDAEGNVARTETLRRSNYKVFKGEAWLEKTAGNWASVGWARITVRRDGILPLFEGAFSIGHDSHHIQLQSHYMQTKHAQDPLLEHDDDEYMVVFRDSDVGTADRSELRRSVQTDITCAAHTLSFNRNPHHPVYANVLKRDVGYWGSMPAASLFGKRQNIDGTTSGNSGNVNLRSSIGSTNGCPTTRKVALIGVATDCEYTSSFNSSQTAHANVITQINLASGVYEKTFDISLGLQNLTVSDGNCPGTPTDATPWNVGCGSNATIASRLSTFSKWRGERNDSNAYWTLLTNCPTGAEVGLAWLGQLCIGTIVPGADNETVSGANVVARTSTEWQVIAHESGHTFGAVHDCTDQTCADGTTVNAQQCCPLSTSVCDANGGYIMNPSTGGQGVDSFSPCTVGNICSAMLRNSVSSSCLTDNKDITTITGQECGNGIVEAGEDCDCGGLAGCATDACCDALTCKFKGNAVCDDSNDECCHSCQFASNGTVCRASTGVCNPEETCSGTSAACPPDETSPNGQGCGNGLSCASGQCTSRDLQCKTVMGSYTTGNDTYACNSQDCTLSCASPSFGPNVCYAMQQNFLDGTSCGGGGSCSNVRSIRPMLACTALTRHRASAPAPPPRRKSPPGSTTTSRWSSASLAASAASSCYPS
jgi:hypothetical protein